MLLSFIRDMFSPILSDRQIEKLYNSGKLVKSRISEHQIQPNSVDLTLANTYSILRPNCTVPPIGNNMDRSDFGGRIPVTHEAIDPRLPIQYDTGTFTVYSKLGRSTSAEYLLQPGEFILMATREKLSIPNGLVGFVCGRSSIARLSIQTEQAGLIDAGFEGTITLEIYNQSKYPITLIEGMRIAHVYFIKAKRAKVIYGAARGSKYNDQVFATGSLINRDPEFQILD